VMGIRRLSSPLPNAPPAGTTTASASPTTSSPATSHRASTGALAASGPSLRSVSVTMKIKDSGKSRVDVIYKDGHRLLINPDNHTYEDMLGRIGNHADALLQQKPLLSA